MWINFNIRKYTGTAEVFVGSIMRGYIIVSLMFLDKSWI